MKFELFSEETNKLWLRMSAKSSADNLQIELELYRKLLNFFQVGDYYYFIFNVKNLEFDLVSSQFETMLGYQHATVTVMLFMDCIHPDDRPWFLAFENKTAEFLSALPVDKLMKYKIRYDFRFRKSDSTYIRVLHQVAVVQHDADGGILRTLGVHTDITHLKPTGRPVMSYIGMDGEPSYLNIDVKNTFAKSTEKLTAREKDVLRLLIEGKLSKEVSEILNISKQTVDTHRKNMMRKNGLSNTGELIGKAINMGWL
ncbi:PAS domain-containing protein [Mucilaginibacter gracilis]|uniref:PAS domain-containing protein n=1 Tax=Mucilaginibacter gracilis TaxID=423350 RepID=A0A495IZP2_9SPHI|nr:LuxR C-terminal-related transcriptional regulator [Mucilaginibacter gracilis]RKR82186.1 PAS domain-containing protein [Mucilaginibacter gracilis]